MGAWGKREGGKSERAGRAREGRRSGRQVAIVTVTKKKEKEGEEGRVRREKGQRATQKMEAKGAPVDFCAGGVRGSDKRGTGGHLPRRRQAWTNRRNRDKRGWLSTFLALRALVKGRGRAWARVDARCFSSRATLKRGGRQNELGRFEWAQK
jgi:hypothetical protein